MSRYHCGIEVNPDAIPYIIVESIIVVFLPFEFAGCFINKNPLFWTWFILNDQFCGAVFAERVYFGQEQYLHGIPIPLSRLKFFVD